MADNAMFPAPVVPSEYVGFRHPALKEFLRRQVDMQFADLRLLFRLPVEELDPNVGCNLTAAAMMLNVISGCSVWLFQTEEAAEIQAREAADGSRRSRERFVGFIKEYWPQIPPEPPPENVAKRLYEVRNSLSHDLGAYDDPKQKHPRIVSLAKHRLSLEDIVLQFERNAAHPLTVPVIEELEGTYLGTSPVSTGRYTGCSRLRSLTGRTRSRGPLQPLTCQRSNRSATRADLASLPGGPPGLK